MLRRCAAAIVMVGALVAPASATAAAKTVSPQDETYLTTAIAGDRFEIQGGTMAAGKTGNAAVKTLAQRLVSDHSKSLKQALAVARRLGIKAPNKPDPPMQWELRITASLAGADFDRWWSDLEVQDHKQDIAEATTEKRAGSNATIKKLAAQEIPTLRTHLKLAEEALAAS
ncbi:MAG: DUF4142 domain-containing protein [Solirubrobacteraceae bacterium]